MTKSIGANPGHAATYYAASARDKRIRPSLEGELNADICVIGAGFTGISAALQLAETGYSVIVVEADRIGFAMLQGAGFAPGGMAAMFTMMNVL